MALVQSTPPDGLTGISPPMVNRPSLTWATEAPSPARRAMGGDSRGDGRIEFGDVDFFLRIGDAGHLVGAVAGPGERMRISMVRRLPDAHAITEIVGLRAMADAGDPDGIELVVLDELLRRQHHGAAPR